MVCYYGTIVSLGQPARQVFSPVQAILQLCSCAELASMSEVEQSSCGATIKFSYRAETQSRLWLPCWKLDYTQLMRMVHMQGH